MAEADLKDRVLVKCLDFIRRRGGKAVTFAQLFGCFSEDAQLRAEVGGNEPGLTAYVRKYFSAYLQVSGQGNRNIVSVASAMAGPSQQRPEASSSLQAHQRAEIYNICMDAFIKRGTDSLSDGQLFAYFSAKPELRETVRNGPQLVQFLKTFFPDKFVLRGSTIVSVDMGRYLEDKARQEEVTKSVLAQPKSKKEIEEERIEKLLAPEADSYSKELEERAVHFFLACFARAGDPQYFPVDLCLEYLTKHGDRELSSYVGSSTIALMRFFKERSYFFVLHSACSAISLQPEHVRDTILALNQSVYKKTVTSGGRAFTDVYAFWQHSNRIPAKGREKFGSSEDDLKKFIKAHPWIFREGFNFVNISSQHELPAFNPERVRSFTFAFAVDRQKLDRLMSERLGPKYVPKPSSLPKRPVPAPAASCSKSNTAPSGPRLPVLPQQEAQGSCVRNGTALLKNGTTLPSCSGNGTPLEGAASSLSLRSSRVSTASDDEDGSREKDVGDTMQRFMESVHQYGGASTALAPDASTVQASPPPPGLSALRGGPLVTNGMAAVVPPPPGLARKMSSGDVAGKSPGDVVCPGCRRPFGTVVVSSSTQTQTQATDLEDEKVKSPPAVATRDSGAQTVRDQDEFLRRILNVKDSMARVYSHGLVGNGFGH